MKAYGYQTAKRDGNEKEMVEAWRACGALWIAQAETAGFDGLLIVGEVVYFVEIKDTSHTQRFSLTDAERAMRLQLLDHKVNYRLVTNMTQALALVGAE